MTTPSEPAGPTAGQLDQGPAFELRHVDRTRLSSAVVDQLLHGIRDGAFPIGEALPAERTLASMLGVSRGTVREAVRVLEHAGVIDVRTGAGTFVTAHALTSASQLRARAAAIGEVSPLDLVAARLALEPTCSAAAAARHHRDDLAAMEQNLAAHAAIAHVGEDSAAVDLEFHTLIATASGNPVLVDMMGLLAPAMRAGLWTQLKHGLHERAGSVAGYVAEHRAVFDAISSGDPAGARDAMVAHLESVRGALLDEIEAEAAAEPAPELGVTREKEEE